MDSTGRARRRRPYRWAAALLPIALATALAAGCGAAEQPGPAPGSPTPTVVKVGLPPLGSTLPVHVADVKGIFERNGLRIERVEAADATLMVPGLAEGQYDIAFSVPTIVLVAAGRGFDIQVVSRMQRSTAAEPNAVWVTRDASITSIEQLAGRTIGVPALTGLLTDAVVYLLHQRGVDRNDVRFVQVPFPAMGDQLRAGRVDAVVAGIPFSSGLAAQGFRIHEDVVVAAVSDASGGAVDNGMTALFAATSAYAREHPDVIRAWRASLNEAIDYLEANDAEARMLLQTWLKMPPEVARKAPLPRWEVEITAEDLQPYVTISTVAGSIDTEPDVDALVWRENP